MMRLMVLIQVLVVQADDPVTLAMATPSPCFHLLYSSNALPSKIPPTINKRMKRAKYEKCFANCQLECILKVTGPTELTFCLALCLTEKCKKLLAIVDGSTLNETYKCTLGITSFICLCFSF